MPVSSFCEPRESEGNATLLVLVDSSQSEYAHIGESVLAALAHFGMPYRLHDLARGPLTGRDLAHQAAAVIAQEHLGLRLAPSDLRALLNAVESGLGLVNFDHDLGAYADFLPDALGLAGWHAGGRVGVDGTDALVVSQNNHSICFTQDAGAAHRFRMPVPMALTRLKGLGPTVLAETPAGAPAVVATRIGQGRAVQWLVSPKLWLLQYFGHAHGLDDLFWKSIVWVARKPFVMKAMPPFVRLRFDDCNGLWRDTANFRFVDVLNQFGHTPSLCLCIRAVTDDGARKISELHARGRAEFAPHTLAPGRSIFYGDEHGPYSEQELQAIMKEVDGLFARWGVRPSRILSDHDHEYSSRVLPLLKERGICFKMNITLPDERWTDIHVDWQPAPYGSMSYVLDYLPGTRDLFVVFNHYPSFDYARADLPDGRFLYNRTGGFGPYMWDFLNGLTASRGDRSGNDIEAAARRLATHTRLGLDSLFFGGSITHSHFTQELSEAEWRELLSRYEELTARYEKRNVPYEMIAEYARGKFDTHLARAEWDPRAEAFHCTLTGETRVPLEVYVFRDVDDAVEHRFETVPEFSGRVDVTFAGN